MARVAIVGCGYVGSALAERLVSDGHHVFVLRRSDVAPAGTQLIRADVTSRDALRALPSPLDCVFYTVAADESSEQEYRRAYVDGLRNVVAALREDVLANAGAVGEPRAASRSQVSRGPQGDDRAIGPQPSVAAPRLILVTSTAVYAQDGGEWVDESSATEPTRFQGRVALESEAIAFGSGFPAIVVRFGGIYGPGRTRLIDQVRRGQASMPAHASYTNRIHRDDCAGVLRHLMAVADPSPLYVGVDREPADAREVLSWLARRFPDAPQPCVDESVESANLEPPAATQRESARTTPALAARGKRCSSDRLIASGYRFEYPTFREGYGTLIASLDRS